MYGSTLLRWIDMVSAMTIGVKAGQSRALLALAFVMIAGLRLLAADDVRAQTAGERWVTLASREVEAASGRTAFDVRGAKGAFKGIRVAVRSGAITLVNVEVRYADGQTHREQRALILRAGAQTATIDARPDERFVDSVALSFRATAGAEPSVRIVVEGLQTQRGLAMQRPGQAPVAVAAEDARTTAQARPKLDGTKPGEPRGLVSVARPPEAAAPPPGPLQQPPAGGAAPSPQPRAEAKGPPAASSTSSGGAGRGGLATGGPAQEPWDVVPVFFGTDRVNEGRSERASYSSERAKRLELGRALVTVPKLHEVPNVERPWVYRLPFTQVVLFREREDPKRHFTVKEATALSRDELVRLVRERLSASRDYRNHALVFVHGFNTSFDAALFRIAQIAYDLKFDGAPFVYSWPSKGQLGFSDYSYDRESSGGAEPYLRQFLEFVSRETGATSVSIIAHSMGNQVLLPVLRDIKRSGPQGVVISQVILAAPDVDRDSFEFLAREISGVSRGVTMLAAANDRALVASRRFWGGVPRAGDVPTAGPVIVDGIDTIDVTSLSTELLSLNHSGYADKPALLGDIQLLIQTGERPPEKRIPILERIKTQRGDYWRYPAMR